MCVISLLALLAIFIGKKITTMEFRQLGESKLSASAITFGAWAIGGWMWGGAERKDAVEAIRASYDQGVTSIDTAPIYGQGLSEELVGEAVVGIPRDKVQIMTKFGMRWDEKKGEFAFKSQDNNGRPLEIYKYAGKDGIIKECEDSLRRLRTDYIDLYQVHWPDLETPYEETAQALLDLQRAGKIRAIGVSNYSIEALERFARVAPLASVQPPLNLFERESERDILPWCRKRGVATLTYGALCRGLLSGAIDEKTSFAGDDLRKTDPKFQPPRFGQYLQAVALLERFAREFYGKGVLPLAVRWVLDTPGVSVALWGARHPGELEPLDDVLGWHLDDEARAYIDEVVRHSVHDPVGPEFMAPPEHAPGASPEQPQAGE
jgi:aryl-alcohol dehydrogenase-like predicted oxidoreductase